MVVRRIDNEFSNRGNVYFITRLVGKCEALAEHGANILEVNIALRVVTILHHGKRVAIRPVAGNFRHLHLRLGEIVMAGTKNHLTLAKFYYPIFVTVLIFVIIIRPHRRVGIGFVHIVKEMNHIIYGRREGFEFELAIIIIIEGQRA